MSAKEMFEELGYEQKINNVNAEMFYKIKRCISDTTYIVFDLKDKDFSKFTNSDSPFGSSQVEDINIKEFKAIQKQIEELGWECDK